MKRMEETNLAVSFGAAGTAFIHSSGAFSFFQGNSCVTLTDEDAQDLAHLITHNQQRHERLPREVFDPRGVDMRQLKGDIAWAIGVLEIDNPSPGSSADRALSYLRRAFDSLAGIPTQVDA